jgi:hypothetical protein
MGHEDTLLGMDITPFYGRVRSGANVRTQILIIDSTTRFLYTADKKIKIF